MSFPVTVTDASTPGPSGPITAWDLNWGDGSGHATGTGPWNHSYAATGNYTLTLQVTGTGGDGTSTASRNIVVSGGTPSGFFAATNWDRPTFTPVRSVPFTSKAQFDAAIADMTSGDLIYYNGSGILTISQSATNGYAIQNKNPASQVCIDFGTSQSQWDPSQESGDFVRFKYTGSHAFDAFWINACSNLLIFGGELDSGIGGNGLTVNAPSHHVIWYDGYVAKCGMSGVSVRGSTSSGGASDCHNLDLRFDVNRWCMNPALDNHADLGTGQHACILHGSSGAIHDSRFVIYGHDALAPGETSAGKTWPEGGGGSVIEQGNATAANYNNVTLAAYGLNNLMIPNGTNPGSTGKQTGGNVINCWGHIKLNGGIVVWAEGVNISGSIIHSDNGSWFPGSPPFTIQHGRHTNTNQSHAGSNISQPYPTTTPSGTTLGIVYNDCT